MIRFINTRPQAAALITAALLMGLLALPFMGEPPGRLYRVALGGLIGLSLDGGVGMFRHAKGYLSRESLCYGLRIGMWFGAFMYVSTYLQEPLWAGLVIAAVSGLAYGALIMLPARHPPAMPELWGKELRSDWRLFGEPALVVVFVVMAASVTGDPRAAALVLALGLFMMRPVRAWHGAPEPVAGLLRGVAGVVLAGMSGALLVG